MRDWQSQTHVKWEGKYHVVFIPKYRKKKNYGALRKQLGHIFRQLCLQKGVELLEGHVMGDHVYMLLSIPPKYSPALIVGYLKGKSAIKIHQQIARDQRGKHFWARGYCVSTVGLDEQMIRDYVKNQEKIDSDNQFDLFE